MPSRTAYREPARFTTSVLPETPANPRDKPASVIPADKADPRRASAMPRISRSRMSRVASGVTSRGVTPVPPTDTTKSTPPITAVFNAFRISTSSASTATTPSTTNPASVSNSVTNGPLWSSSPCAVRSSTTTTSARPTTNSAPCSMGATV
jgi:hypothetical protein